MVKEVLIKLKDELYEPLKKIREISGIAVNNQIYRYIYMGLIKEGLISIKECLGNQTIEELQREKAVQRETETRIKHGMS